MNGLEIFRAILSVMEEWKSITDEIEIFVLDYASSARAARAAIAASSQTLGTPLARQ